MEAKTFEIKCPMCGAEQEALDRDRNTTVECVSCKKRILAVPAHPSPPKESPTCPNCSSNNTKPDSKALKFILTNLFFAAGIIAFFINVELGVLIVIVLSPATVVSLHMLLCPDNYYCGYCGMRFKRDVTSWANKPLQSE